MHIYLTMQCFQTSASIRDLCTLKEHLGKMAANLYAPVKMEKQECTDVHPSKLLFLKTKEKNAS